MKWLIFALRLALGAVFLYAGLIKAGASEEFALALVPFTFVPAEWMGNLAIVLACVEILCGLLVLLPRIYPLGALIILVLSLIFITALTWALMNGIVVDCSCFGRDDEPPSAEKMMLAVGRDVALLAASATILIWHFRQLRKSRR